MEELRCTLLATNLVFDGPRAVPRGILTRHSICFGSDLRPKTARLSPFWGVDHTHCNDFRKGKMAKDSDKRPWILSAVPVQLSFIDFDVEY